MKIGNTIKKLRKSKGMNQSEFAEKCDITQAYLSQIENNKREISITCLKNISDFLEIPASVILFLSIDKEELNLGDSEYLEDIHTHAKELFSYVLNNKKGTK